MTAAVRRRNQRGALGHAEAAEHGVGRVDVLIDSDVALMIAVFRDGIDRVVPGEHVVSRRGGKFLQQPECVLIHAAGRNLVVAGRIERIANPRRRAGRNGSAGHRVDRARCDQPRRRGIEDRPERERPAEPVCARTALEPNQVRHVGEVALLHARGRRRAGSR